MYVNTNFEYHYGYPCIKVYQLPCLVTNTFQLVLTKYYIKEVSMNLNNEKSSLNLHLLLISDYKPYNFVNVEINPFECVI